MSGNFQSLRPSWIETEVTGQGAWFGTAGCLDLVLLVSATLWQSRKGQLATGALEQHLGAYLADGSGLWTPPDSWDAEDLAIEIGDHPCV